MSRCSPLTTAAAVAVILLVSLPSTGDTSPRTARLWFDHAMALPGVTLSPGTYLFEQHDPSSPDLVVVRSRDRKTIHFLGFTTRVERPAWLPADRSIAADEIEAGAPPRIAAWYPAYDSRGYAFLYGR
jgi:hypothetical protein